MLAITSLFNTGMNQTTHKIWDDLETQCMLSGIKITPIPHFSWHVALNYSEGVASILKRFTKKIDPFVVIASGIGVFEGKNPVIYIQILKTSELIRLHSKLWDDMADVAKSTNINYSPDRWVPHLTIAYGDVTVDKIGCAAKTLVFRDLHMEICVDNLAIIYNEDNQVGIKEKFLFRTI
jgi:2'-5' RNA ligase